MAHYAIADGRPVAAAMAGTFDGVGVVGWVGTDPAYRYKGIGTAVTRASTNAAFDLGARIVSLQASPDGYPVYLKMGFRVVAGYAIWVPGEPPHGPASQPLVEPHTDPRTVTELLDAIPGALERALQGRGEARRGEGTPLGDL